MATGQGVALGRMLRLHVALGAVWFDELTETRVLLERGAARAAAGKAGAADIAELERLLAEMVANSDERTFNELDTAFHLAIAGSGANRLMRDITVAIREAVAERILVAERELDAWPRFRDRLNQQHRAIRGKRRRARQGPTPEQGFRIMVGEMRFGKPGKREPVTFAWL